MESPTDGMDRRSGVRIAPGPGWLAPCFFVSGATSLVLEVAWAKQLSYVFGTTLYAVTTVVAAFMGGLAFGSWVSSRWSGRLERPVLAYAALQGLIAACGIASIPVLRAAPLIFAPVYQALGEWPLVFFAGRFALVFLLLLLPVTLMGMTLPLVTGVFGRARERYEFESGLLYGINTLGAVVGTLLAGFVLVPWLGLTATCVGVGVVDAVVGGAALVIHARVGRLPPVPASTPLRTRGLRLGRPESIGGLYFLSGMAAIVLEVVWFRYLAYVFGPTADAFSVMLGVFLAGVGLGSLLGAQLARTTTAPLVLLARLQLVLALLVVATAGLWNRLPEVYGGLYWWLGSAAPGMAALVAAQGVVGALVVLPSTLVMGALFPVAVRAFAEASARARDAERTVGRLYAFNTVGGIVGSFAGGLWLLPRLGMLDTTLLVSGVNLALGLAFAGLGRSTGQRAGAGWIAAGLVLFVALAATLPQLDLLALNKGSYLALANEQGFRQMMLASYDADRRLLFQQEGVNASVAVTANDGGSGNLFLRVSGKPVADTRFDGRAHLVLLGQLPFLFAEDPRTAAVIGFGAGITTGSSLTHESLERLDVIELESRIFEASRYFSATNGDPLSDPRVRVIVEDGRTWLGYTDEKYDVITSDPISPLVAGAANLYTRDFYETVSDRLAPGGVFSQWWETWVPSERTYKGVLASIADAFPHVAVFMIFGDSVILASNDPIALPWEQLVRRFDEPRVRRDLAELQIDTPEQLTTLLLADTEQIRAWLADAGPPNTDDHNWLERTMPLELNRSNRRNLERLILERFASTRMSALERMLPGLPVDEVLRTTVQPDASVFGGPAPVLARGFLDEYRRRGQTERVQRIREWIRDFEGGGAKRLGRERYRGLVAEAEAAKQRGDDATAEALYRELLEFPGQPAYHTSGIALAGLLARAGRDEEALDVARRMQARFPAHPQAYAIEVRILADRAGDAACAVARRAALLGADVSRASTAAGCHP